MSSSSPTVARTRAQASVVRAAFHRMARRSGLPSAPRHTSPIIWPESPMPRTCEGAVPEAAITSATALSAACHQSSGSCSDQPLWGWWSG